METFEGFVSTFTGAVMLADTGFHDDVASF